MSELIPSNSSRNTAAPNETASSTNQVSTALRSSQSSWTRIMLAGGIALAADSIGIIPGEAFPVVFDVAVAIALAIVLGPRPILLVGLVLEAIPVVGLFPSWLAVIGAIALQRRKAGA